MLRKNKDIPFIQCYKSTNKATLFLIITAKLKRPLFQKTENAALIKSLLNLTSFSP